MEINAVVMMPFDVEDLNSNDRNRHKATDPVKAQASFMRALCLLLFCMIE